MDKKDGGLTWPKAALWIGLAQLLGVAAGIALAAGHVFLAPPAMASTGVLYLLVATAPPITTLIVCMLKRPSGKFIWGMLVMLFGVLLACFYLMLIGPVVGYDTVKCEAPSQRGIFIRQECTCQFISNSDGRPSGCILEGPSFLPFRQVTEPDKP